LTVLRSLASFVVVTGLALTLTPPAAVAAPPTRGIPYSGRLELDGAPVTASLPMTFKLYDVASSGTAMFTQEQDVQVVGGAFAVVLGTQPGKPLPEGAFTASALYLGIEVNGTPLQGRQQVFAAAQAVRAGQADNFTVSSTLTADSVQANGVSTGYLNSAGRLHISNNSDDIYLLARAGQVRVSNLWGSNGNLTVDGTVSAGGVSTGGTVSAGTVTASGNVTGANLVTSGAVFVGLYRHDCTWSVYGTHDCGCPSGYNVLGGGASCETGHLFESRPINASTWRVRCGYGENYEWPKNVLGMTLICARIGY
jgi:hypothetical protein